MGLASELRHRVIVQFEGKEKLPTYRGNTDAYIGSNDLVGEESSIFDYTQNRDENGFFLPESNRWETYRILWAKVTPVAARDLSLGQAELTEVTARMKIRYRVDINTSMRIIWKDKIYSIVSEGLDDNENGFTYTTFNLSSGVEVSANG